MDAAGKLPELDLQPGPQQRAGDSDADVIFYGGQKGGGKSYWLAWESAKWFDLPGHSSIIFRRTYPELTGEGSLWEETTRIYPRLGGTPTESKLRWVFPSRSSVALRHLQDQAAADRWNGKNIGDIGLDELPYMLESQFWTLISCQRASMGGYQARPRVRATMNPDPDSWVLQFVDWYLGANGCADPDLSGTVRWFGRKSGKLSWYDCREAAVEDGIDIPKSFTFIAASVFDNAILMRDRPEYLANLKALPPVQQARYLGGNWRVREQAGDYFREGWFPIRGWSPIAWKVKGHPHDDEIVRKFRMWDLAGTPWEGDTVLPGTPARSSGEQPCWTRGGLFGVTRRGQMILLDMKGWRDSPGAIEAAMIRTHLDDGPAVECCVGHDPGQAGEYQMEALERVLRRKGKVRTFHPVRAHKGKEVYAAQASRYAYAGKILVQRAGWNRAFFNELEAFPGRPEDLTKPFMDQVDVLSQAVEFVFGEGTGRFDGLDGTGEARRGGRVLDVDVGSIGGARIL